MLMEFKETQVTIVNKYVSQEDMSKNVLEIIVNKFLDYVNSPSAIKAAKKEKAAG